jgi:predicted NUDIX family phosphoesterase
LRQLQPIDSQEEEISLEKDSSIVTFSGLIDDDNNEERRAILIGAMIAVIILFIVLKVTSNDYESKQEQSREGIK